MSFWAKVLLGLVLSSGITTGAFDNVKYYEIYIVLTKVCFQSSNILPSWVLVTWSRRLLAGSTKLVDVDSTKANKRPYLWYLENPGSTLIWQKSVSIDASWQSKICLRIVENGMLWNLDSKKQFFAKTWAKADDVHERLWPSPMK